MDTPRRFMIVDDSEVDRFVHSKLLMLSDLASQVESCSSGQEGLDYLRQNAKDSELLPDIVLLDIMMPEMTGFDFLVHYDNFIHELVKKPLIFMLSSSEDDRDAKRCAENPHVIKLLAKPFAPRTLRAILADLEL